MRVNRTAMVVGVILGTLFLGPAVSTAQQQRTLTGFQRFSLHHNGLPLTPDCSPGWIGRSGSSG